MPGKRLIILIVILIFMAGMYFVHTPGFQGSGIVKLPAEAKDRISIQYFMAQMCSACRDMEPVLDEVKKVYDDQVLIQVIDVHTRPGTIKAYGISVVPALAVYDSDGKLSFSNEGVMNAREVFSVLDTIMHKP